MACLHTGPSEEKTLSIVSFMSCSKTTLDARAIDVGITEFLIYYPFSAEQLPMFEKIAREVIPELKEKYNR
jgi:hypothetical protein